MSNPLRNHIAKLAAEAKSAEKALDSAASLPPPPPPPLPPAQKAKKPKQADGPESLIPMSEEGLILQPLGDTPDPWAQALEAVDDPLDFTPRRDRFEESGRQPGENIREYVGRLRAMMGDSRNHEAVANAVGLLEADLSTALESGLVGPPRLRTRPDSAARSRQWHLWRLENPATYDDKMNEAVDAMVASGHIKREGNVFTDAHSGTVLSDDDHFKPFDIQALASQHMGDEFFGDNARALRASATQDYTDYLAAHGVDQRTIDDISSGVLSMLPEERVRRAKQMGLDPDVTWYRWDDPLKKDFRGWTGAALSQPEYSRTKKGTQAFIALPASKEGLVYTSHNQQYGRIGAQMQHPTLYPLAGPKDGIAGLDQLPDSAYDAFSAKQKEMLLKREPDLPSYRRDYQRKHPLAEHIAGGGAGNLESYHDWRQHAMKVLQGIGPHDLLPKKTKEAIETIPNFRTAENRKKYTEPLLASGAKGTLVSDETGISTAFTPAGARQFRRLDLAPFDVRFRDARNVLQSLLVPAIAAGGASQQPGLLGGLTSRNEESR